MTTNRSTLTVSQQMLMTKLELTYSSEDHDIHTTMEPAMNSVHFEY